MIKIENTEVFGWEAAIKGMRNPKASWAKSDTVYGTYWGEIDGHKCFDDEGFRIGDNDLKLMKTLANAGTDHGKFLRMIHVQADITAPEYWWKEYSTYKVGTVENSTSTMHRIHAKKFTLEDFSHEHLVNDYDHAKSIADNFWENEWLENLHVTIARLNRARELFLETKDKKYWWQMIQLLPMSYNYTRTVDLNYAVLRNMYHARKNHKLDEWHEFCDWIEDKLPYAKKLICDD